jgi:acyl phosphate:glycerol-3-phosphate acyltransferase
MHELISLLIGYLFGSLPFAVWIARSKGVDIFKAGSGNPGATNVKRSVGKTEGNICFALDAAKGFVAVLVALAMFGPLGWAAPLALVGAILGHSFSYVIGFKGGKGVATTVGGVFALLPLVMLLGVVVWAAVFYASRYVSLASIVMAIWLPVGALLMHASFPQSVVATLIGVVVVVRHRANIERLIKGTESRFAKK